MQMDMEIFAIGGLSCSTWLRSFAPELLGRRISSVRALAVSLFMLVPIPISIPIPSLSLVATCLGDSGFLPPQKHDFKGISMGQHVPRGPTRQLSNNCTRNCPEIKPDNWQVGGWDGTVVVVKRGRLHPRQSFSPTSTYLPSICLYHFTPYTNILFKVEF